MFSPKQNPIRRSVHVLVLIAGLVAAGTHGTRAGTVEGLLSAQGRDEAADSTSGGAYASRRYRFLERVDYTTLRDFVVWLEGSTVPPPASTSEVKRVVVQKDGLFDPHVMPIQVGTTVEWPNEDDIFHNVFSISEPKPFDLGLYKHPDVKRVNFDQAGRVDIFCSIHKSMHCIILILETPWFAHLNAGDRYRISNVPAGAYRLRAWHERLPSQVREITVTEHGTTTVDVVMSVSGLPQY